MKYIIKNCDCYGFGDACLSNNSERLYCKDITDCLMKRIVEKCKFQLSEFDEEIKNGAYIDKYKYFKSGRSDAGKEILELLESEEADD